MLLDLIAEHTPVEGWPTQMTKQQRTDHAREAAQADAADADRPSNTRAEADKVDDATVVPLRPTRRARHVERAVDAERRRRREAAVPVRPDPPPLLGEAMRRGSLFLLPGDDDEPVERQHGGQDQ